MIKYVYPQCLKRTVSGREGKCGCVFFCTSTYAFVHILMFSVDTHGGLCVQKCAQACSTCVRMHICSSARGHCMITCPHTFTHARLKTSRNVSVCVCECVCAPRRKYLAY